MRNSRNGILSPSGSEQTTAAFYLVFQLMALSALLTWLNGRLSNPLSQAELNFTYYLINFLAVVLIFHDFLGRCLRQVWQHPAYFCQAVILGLAAYYACSRCVNWIVGLLVPGFSNYNDQSIAAMSRGSYFLMAVGTVILVPPAEECMYRGLIFRRLYSKSPWAAYLVSMLVFAAIHILGYVGRYSPLELVMAVLQYLPAGLCLAWTYTKSGTIFAPILVHGLINLSAIGGLR